MMKQLIVLSGVAGASLSAVFVRWATAPSLVLVFYRMAITAALMMPVLPVVAAHRYLPSRPTKRT